MKKVYTAVVVALVALALGATAAFAAVTFDPATGNGFVGKGDVQTAFGWNNATMQQNHQGVTFRYVATNTYSFDCEWYTGPTHNRTQHVNTKEASTAVNASLASDSRRTGQWTGWFLNGYPGGAPNPVAGPTDADCGSEGNEMKTIVANSVKLISSSGGLYAVYNGDARLLQ